MDGVRVLWYVKNYFGFNSHLQRFEQTSQTPTQSDCRHPHYHRNILFDRRMYIAIKRDDNG